ncbi:glycosyltransferase [Blastococcus sp. KM273129]|uniref:glycosyltransferase n=1 Tax=Blastococcus sp. KM273129 TaxID=2570315 RepID=UPI001F23D9A9|nr:glycosyltransferase [Blastococcus sp. KM273129]
MTARGEAGPRVAVVVPVHGNEATLAELADRLGAALAGRPWRLRLVVDASPDASAAVARTLAAADARIAVTELAVNVGQHAALAHGLAEEAAADVWVCLDADLQDPPEAVPLLLDRLAAGDVAAVFAGRRGRYESPLRRLTGTLHRRVAGRLTGLPPDAGAFLAMGPAVRAAVVTAVREQGAPSVVLAVGRAGRPVASVPVVRDRRPVGRSAWTARARLRQSLGSLAWAVRARR